MSELHYSNNGEYFFSYFGRRKNDNNLFAQKVGIDPASKKDRSKSLENLSKGFISKGISLATRKKIALRVRVLAHAAELKKVKDHRGDFVRHRCTFYTMTLPSEQVHSDQVITKEVLGSFLDLCRKNKILQNYVWRAEKQKNGNIHYHLITDSYVQKNLVYRYWLMALERLGYVSAYHKKFARMDLQSYKRLPFNANVSDVVICGRFWKGNRNNWQKPPCFDTINCDSVGGVSRYISKYISKDSENDSAIVGGRCWGCSSSVSVGTDFFKNDKDFNEFGFKMSAQVLERKILVKDFFSMVFQKISSFFTWFPAETAELLDSLRRIIIPCQFHTRGQSAIYF